MIDGGGGSPRAAGLALVENLRRDPRIGEPIIDDGGLTPTVVAQIDAHFRQAPIRAKGLRDNWAYWDDHGRVTSALMKGFCLNSGRAGRSDLYAAVGLIHDIDYLGHPHEAPPAGLSHPGPLVNELQMHGVHPAICLAITEHAPYLGLDRAPSSRLSATLSFCEDLATFLSIRPSPDRAPVGAILEMTGVAEPHEFIDRPSDAPLRVEHDLNRYVLGPFCMASNPDYGFAYDV